MDEKEIRLKCLELASDYTVICNGCQKGKGAGFDVAQGLFEFITSTGRFSPARTNERKRKQLSRVTKKNIPASSLTKASPRPRSPSRPAKSAKGKI